MPETATAALVVHRTDPLNCETPIPPLIDGLLTPNARFYVRNHFQTPQLDQQTWRLQVFGLVQRPLRLSLRDVRSMPSQTLAVTLECAGNGRFAFDPRTDGEQWHLGTVSTAEWTGVPLTEVLDRAGFTSGALEVIFQGADHGQTEDGGRTVRFERSLSVADARQSGALLAYMMNGEPLPPEHGYPLRLIVPGWYAVASVKWLTHIEVTDSPFRGFFQNERYVYESQRGGTTLREPVRLVRVRSIITEPSGDEPLATGDVIIRGVAWSGAAPIAKVQVSVGNGAWQDAALVGKRRRHSWQWWELPTRLDRTGQTTLRARATDEAGHAQPEQPEWNRLGYGGNAVHAVTIVVR
jgi:DMSO/TMAO reductase YedYZ molybdopterin-dependent catalytic subunit